MSRLIDLDDDRNIFCGHDGEYEKWNIDPDTIEERKTGKWIEITPEEGNDIFTVKCDQCGKYDFFETNFCSNCGAKMNGGEEG